MKKEAIVSAEDKVRQARVAAEKFTSASSFEEALDAWTYFLFASSGVYAKLEQGCKDNPKSIAWHSHKKNERKKDKLLQYVHQARNADTHGMSRVARNDVGVGFNKTLSFNERIPIEVRRLDNDGITPIGDPIKGVLAGPSARLIEVTNRGCTYYPPDEHLGDPLPYGTDFPDVVMRAMIAYLEAMIAEAKAL